MKYFYCIFFNQKGVTYDIKQSFFAKKAYYPSLLGEN